MNIDSDNYSQSEDNMIAVLSFYSFTNIENPEILQPQILLVAKKKYIYGTILISSEGFNGSISGKEENLNVLIDEIKKLTNPKDINIKVNYCKSQPFSRIKVKLKKEIVALKYSDSLNIEEQKGEYIETDDWDDFISRDDVITIDTRNDYEVKIGTFKNSVNPNTETFRQLPDWTKKNMDKFKDKKVAMFCTGGIRCEKSTALLNDLGVDQVYHLRGGILQYLEDTKNKNGLWKGECFVFDDRGAVSSDLNPSEGFWVQKGQTAKSVSNSK